MPQPGPRWCGGRRAGRNKGGGGGDVETVALGHTAPGQKAGDAANAGGGTGIQGGGSEMGEDRG